MDIRSAEVRDATAVADVHVRSWKAAYPGLIPQPYLDSLRAEDRLASWTRIIRRSEWPRSGVLLLIDADERVVGFSHVCPTRDHDRDPLTVGEITSIYLAPEAWGAGHGVAMMKASVERLVEAGYDTATLWALDTNARARRFYETGGWTADGTTKVHDWGSFVCTDVRYVLDLRTL